jgi:fission process protein 1
MSETGEYDIFRDSPLRHAGYADEVGEAFRPIIPRYLVWSSYAISLAYTCGDVFDKALKKNAMESSMPAVVQQAADTLLWQVFSSFLIPPLLVNRTSATARWVVHRIPMLAARPGFVRWTPVFAGLSIIPLCPKFVDPLVDEVMDKYVRPLLGGSSGSEEEES